MMDGVAQDKAGFTLAAIALFIVSLVAAFFLFPKPTIYETGATSFCYDENARNPVCTAEGVGSYTCTGNWDRTRTCANVYDDNWGTWGMAESGNVVGAQLIIVYALPDNVTHEGGVMGTGSLWRIRDGGGYANLSLEECPVDEEVEPPTLTLTVSLLNTPPVLRYARWSCSGNILRENITTATAYEEGVDWYGEAPDAYITVTHTFDTNATFATLPWNGTTCFPATNQTESGTGVYRVRHSNAGSPPLPVSARINASIAPCYNLTLALGHDKCVDGIKINTSNQSLGEISTEEEFIWAWMDYAGNNCTRTSPRYKLYIE
jgi:hypothetical protein